ncbi:MAG: hypothetical protein COA78_12755 [Blastopirellula sp.]|nr:MAG: hypothetical protein COA78_12755 [Blastopirellula sp.]
MNLKNISTSDQQHQILLSPKLTALVIVDHQMAFEQCFDIEDIKSAENGVANLLDVASKVDVPVITSLVKTNSIDSKLSVRLEKTIPELARFNRSGINPWDDPAFADAVQIANKPRLLIAGLSAETSLSFTALCGLERGFDVYVVKDACLGYSKQSIAITFDRLTQAGVVPVSWRQVVLEWSQGSVDEGMLRRLLRAHRTRKLNDSMP